MIISFQNKKVLITGATRGIGEQIALDIEKTGGEVFITGTEDSSYEAFKKNNPGSSVKFLAVNFQDDKSFAMFLEKCSTLEFDCLVNNAGINKIDSLQEIDIEDWDAIQKVNVRAPFLITQKLFSSMKAKGYGRVINIASIFGVVTKEKRLSYSTSKHGLIGMTKTMALDMADSGVLVNCVSPGFIDTELTRKVLGDVGMLEVTSQVPLKRMGKTSDVSGIVQFLLSSQNQFITGQNIVADGGFTCV